MASEKRKIKIDVEAAGEFLISTDSLAGEFLILNKDEDVSAVTLQCDGVESVDMVANPTSLVLISQNMEVTLFNIADAAAVAALALLLNQWITDNVTP